MKKRFFLAVVLVLAMLLPNTMWVSADEVSATIASGYSIGGWSGPYYSNTTDYGEKIGVTFDGAKSGNSSICLQFPAGGENYANRPGRYIYYVNNKAPEVTFTAGTTYTLGVWVKGWDKKAKGSIWLGLDATNNNFRAEINKTGETEDGWTLLYRDFTPSTSKTAAVYLVLDKICGAADAAGPSTALFDNAFIKVKDTDVNLMADSSFEGYRTQSAKVGDGKASLRISGWKEYQEVATNAEAGFYVMPVSGEGIVYSGNKAAYVYRKTNVTQLNGNAYIRNDAGGYIPAGEYKITFYVKGTCTENQNFIGIRNYTERFINHTKTYVGNGWYRYERTFTTTEDKDYLEYYLSGYALNESYYIDGLSLVNTATGEEYATNGGFEECYLYGEYEPQRFVVYSASNTNTGKATVAWKNPTKTDITAISLTVDGDEISFEPDLNSGSSNEVVLEDIENKGTYNCVLNITAGGKTYTYSKVLYQYDKDKYYNCAGNRTLESGWSFIRQEKEGFYCDAVLDIDNEIKASGNSSIRITCARPAKESSVYAALVTKNASLAKNKAYRLSYKIRYIGASGVRVVPIIAGKWDNDNAQSFSGREKWKEYDYEIDVQDAFAEDDETYKFQVMFLFENGTDAVWLDDVALYEYEDGETIGENLISNGGFEFADEFAVIGYEYNLTMDGEILDAVSNLEEGEILGRVNINNYSKENLNVTAVTAIYEDGKLIGASLAESPIPITVNPFMGTRVGGSVTVPEMDAEKTYEMRVFAWDSLGHCQPLGKPGVLTQAETE